MNQFIYVLLAAAAMYFFVATMVKTAGALSSASFMIGGLKVPVLPAILFTGMIALVCWILFDAFGIRLVALSALVAIEAVAFYSMESGEATNSSATIWLLKAFTLGGLFIAALTMLAQPSVS
jgi:hypothetical protein